MLKAYLTKKVTLRMSLLVAGAVYFQAFSHLSVNPYLKNFLILMPVQVAALLYVAYVYWLKPEDSDMD